MIDAVIDLPHWGWTVNLHCAVTCYHTGKILRELRRIGCPGEFIRLSKDLLLQCRLNTGLTFTNPGLRTSVVVVALSSDGAQFINSLEHEIRHLVDNICEEDGITDAEKVAYLTGEINQAIHPLVEHLICDHCRCEE